MLGLFLGASNGVAVLFVVFVVFVVAGFRADRLVAARAVEYGPGTAEDAL